MGRVIAAFAQFFDGTGAPLSRGWLRFTESGTNNTDKNTYFDAVYQIPNNNPLQLDSEGRCPNVFGTGDYRVVLFENDPEDEDSPGEQIQLFDPVTAEAAASTGGGGGSFEIWDAGTEYDLYDIVTYNTDYYRSLTASNLNNNPAIETSFWEKIDFVHFYNATITYSAGALIRYNYNLYISKQSLNAGNDPESSPAWWRPVATEYYMTHVKTTDYEILPTEFDSIFVLSSAAIANSTFSLPAMDATTDGFKVALYNASLYELTVSALTGSIWIDSTGELILEDGAFCEFRYNHDLLTWMPANNAGQALGGQTLGTLTTPVSLLHLIDANVINADISSVLNANEIHIPSDEHIYMGDSDEAAISYNSVDASLDIDVAAANSLDFLIDGVLQWAIISSGAFVPGSINPSKNLGDSGNRINYVYTTYVSLPDNGIVYLGSGNSASIFHDGSASYFKADLGAMSIGTYNASNLNFITNSSQALLINTSLNVFMYGTTFNMVGASQYINMGSPLNMRMVHDDTNGYFDIASGTLIFRVTGSFTTALTIDTNANVNFFNNTTIGTNEYHYLGDANNARLGYPGYLLIGTISNVQIVFQTNNASRWQITSAGHLLPFNDLLYNIGSASVRVNNIYARYFNIERVRAPGDLTLEINNGVFDSPYDYNSLSITRIVRTSATNAQIYLTINGIEGYLSLSHVI